MTNYIEMLNAENAKQRLSALDKVLENQREKPSFRENDANNHIHTTYSFSPYSPTKAAYMAYMAGLTSAGIMDHDSLSGVKEFKSACKKLGIGSTAGVEVRAKFTKGFGRINHPDQMDCAYMAAHGIPAQNVDKFNEWLERFRQKRNERNDKMCQSITQKYGRFGVTIDFEKDVKPLSNADEGGSITERHLLYALAIKLENKFSRTQKLIDFLVYDLGLTVSEKVKGYLLDQNNENFLFDLLGVLKMDTAFFYINANEEMPDVNEFVEKAKEFGAIPTYAYLGDVGNSVTGDKKTQKFEDDYLDELVAELKRIGFQAIAYMPTRNTPEQLKRLQKLARENQFFEISGEDINSPRQIFTCKALAEPDYSHLIESTWALIGHESISTEKGLDYGMFSERTIKETPDLYERIKKFAIIGKQTI